MPSTSACRAHVALRHPGGPQEESHIAEGFSPGGGHLVQQRLERVVGVAVNQRDVHVGLPSARTAVNYKHPARTTTCGLRRTGHRGRAGALGST